jgi:microcin C transport system permease protein
MNPPTATDRFLGFRISPMTRRRLYNFRANRRGWWSFWIFMVLFTATLFAEFIANDKPVLIHFDGAYYAPVFKAYPETIFGGEFETEAEYRDPFVQEMINAKG